MDNEKLPAPPIIDFPEYNEDIQDYLWPVIVKYYGKPDIEFFASKSEIIKTFQLLDKLYEDDSDEPITIGNHTFELKNLNFMQFEGRTYDFS